MIFAQPESANARHWRASAYERPRCGNRSAAAALTLHQTINTYHSRTQEAEMLGWAVTFLVIALIAAALGFGGIAGTSAGIAQVLFFIFIVLFVVAMIARALRGRPPI
jgi:uncharacterized membrane protein YtjA (UPF0391 family)